MLQETRQRNSNAQHLWGARPVSIVEHHPLPTSLASIQYNQQPSSHSQNELNSLQPKQANPAPIEASSSSNNSDDLSEDEPRQGQVEQNAGENAHAAQVEHAPTNQIQMQEQQLS